MFDSGRSFCLRLVVAGSGVLLLLIAAGDVWAEGRGAHEKVPTDSVESVAAVRVDADADYVPDRRGDTVTVAGRSVVATGTFVPSNRIAVQDPTSGIHVLLPESVEVGRGDSVRVRGVVEHANGLTRLRALDASLHSEPARIPAPMPLTVPAARGEGYEGRFVHLRGRVERMGTNDGGQYLILSDRDEVSSEQIAVFVPNQRLSRVQIDRFEAGDEVSVTGVLGQYDYNAPYDDFYQIHPRDAADLQQINWAGTYLWGALYVLMGGGLCAVGIIAFLRVAVRRRTRELDASRARFRRLAEATDEGILLHDGDRVIDVNEAFAAMVGRKREGLVGHDVTAVIKDTIRPGDASEPQGLLRGTTEAELVRDGAPPCPVKVEARTVETDDRTVQVVAVRDITKRKEWERELVRAKNEAEEMARLKSNLLSNMSHELRTPITSITGYAELIMEEADGLHAEHAARIQKSGRRLFETLQSVLEMAQLEAGTLDIDPQPVDVAEVVQEVVEVHALSAREKSLSIHVDVATDGLFQTDRRFLHRILSNLVHNAVKFTDEGAVWVRAEGGGEAVRLTVRDTGMGIEPEVQEHLFDAFRQGTEGRDRTHEGTGLGLSLTRRMVEVLGGTIEVESTKGEGSTFAVELPSVPADGIPTGREGHPAEPADPGA